MRYFAFCVVLVYALVFRMVYRVLGRSCLVWRHKQHSKQHWAFLNLWTAAAAYVGGCYMEEAIGQQQYFASDWANWNVRLPLPALCNC